MPTLSPQVEKEILGFLLTNHANLLKYWDTDPSDPEDGITITFSCNDDGTEWSYQTGDNSYTGACYHHPHWAVTWINHESDMVEIADDIIESLNDCLES